jgi:hypothetical protein
LSGSNLSGSNLSGSDLSKIDANEMNRIKSLFQIIPEMGDFIAWKKLQNGLMAQLLIPAKAKRTCNLKSRKCRAEYAKVLAIFDGNKRALTGNSQHDHSFIYKVGKIVRPDKYDNNFLEDCSNGIHFFISRYEAENY